MTSAPTLSEDEQRKFQAEYWGLPPVATWDQIHKAVRSGERAPLFFHPDDWVETMNRLYGLTLAA